MSDRIITAIFLRRNAKATLTKVYAPKEMAKEDEKDKFNELLQEVLDNVPSYDIRLVIGDYNAKIGQLRHATEQVIGLHGSATEMKDNGERLTMTYSTVGLCVSNTFLQHKNIGTQNNVDIF